MNFGVIFSALFLGVQYANAQTLEQTQVMLNSINQANAFCTSSQSSCLRASYRPIKNPRSLSANSSTENSAPVVNNQEPSQFTFSNAKITDYHGRDLDITVIPEAQINSLTRLYPKNLKPFNAELCASTAHVIGDTLAKQGVETVKLLARPKGSLIFTNFIIPDEKARDGNGRTPQWDFHIVNLVYVQKADGSLTEYIIDPFLESKPVPRDHWEARIRKNPKSSVGSLEVHSRYVLDDRDRRNRDLQYDEERLRRSYQRLSNN